MSVQKDKSHSKKVAYLGMGIMGAAMAHNLLKAGHAVTVYNRTKTRPALAELAQSGASVADSLAQCVKDADIVFSCLGDEHDVASVLTGTGGVIEHLAKGAIVVDFSTIGPDMAIKISSDFARCGIEFLDAPVTGGDVGARLGTLTIMVGGDKTAFEQVQPLLSAMGKTIVHCGKSGSGQALKLCNQVLCAVNLIAVVEAFDLAQKLGLAPALVVDALGSGAGGSWALNTLGPRILKEDFAPGFSIQHMLKDLRLVKESLGAVQAQNATDGAGDLAGTELAVTLFNKVLAIRGSEGLQMGTQAMQLAFKG